MDAVDSAPLGHGLDQLGRAPGPAQHSISIRMMAVIGAFQHGFGLFFPDTAAAEWKGEFLTTTDGQHGMKQSGGGKNVHQRQTKIGVDGLIARLGDDLRMTDGVGTIFVDPGIERRDIHVTYLLSLSSHSTGTAPSPKASRGSIGGTRSNERTNC